MGVARPWLVATGVVLGGCASNTIRLADDDSGGHDSIDDGGTYETSNHDGEGLSASGGFSGDAGHDDAPWTSDGGTWTSAGDGSETSDGDDSGTTDDGDETSGVEPWCGNGTVDDRSELCDGEDLGGHSCDDIPWGHGGELACTPTCELDPTGCLLAHGAVVISEIFYSPKLVPLSVPGQWLELHNPSAMGSVSLAGCIVDGGSSFEIFEIGALTIPPLGYASLGTGTSQELGMTPDFTIPPGFILMNDGDSIELTCDGELLDMVEYGNSEPWPAFNPGVSIALHPSALTPFANDHPEVWCASTTEYGLEQLGTPGAPNDCF